MGALHHFKIEIVWHPRNLQERYTKSIGIAINISENLEILSSRIKPVDSMLGICESQPLAVSILPKGTAYDPMQPFQMNLQSSH